MSSNGWIIDDKGDWHSLNSLNSKKMLREQEDQEKESFLKRLGINKKSVKPEQKSSDWTEEEIEAAK